MRQPDVEVNLARLAEERMEKKLSFSDVSYVLGYKTPTGYWLIEHGERGVSVSVLYKLAKLYDKPMDYFITELEEK